MLLSKKLLFYQNLFPKEFYTPGHYQTYMIPGTYYVITRSAGGAGGENGANGSWSGGVGGAGGYGEITSQIITVKDFVVADVYVGAGGKLRANGGNGGAGGSPAGSGHSGGNGGGGGEPSYVVINSYLVSAEAGGGGGGGGGCAGGPGRRSGGGAGGGGGGYYELGTPTSNTLRAVKIYWHFSTENGQIMSDVSTEPRDSGESYVEIPENEELYVGKSFSRTKTTTDFITFTTVTTATVKEIKNDGNVVFDCSYYEDLANLELKKDLEVEDLLTVQGSFAIIPIAGKTGGTGASYYQYGSAGQNGRTTDGGNLITAGRGGGGSHYQTGAGGAGGAGFGASGGGGNAGDANNHTHESGKGGFGGGGAGGSITAAGGGITVQDWGTVATAGSNHFTTPVDTTAENAEYGITGNYGTGGTTATEGQGGCVIIRFVNTATEFIDLGDVVTIAPTTIDDAGTITGETEESDDAGAITGTVESSDDAGLIYDSTGATPWMLGLITETVTETKNCGNII